MSRILYVHSVIVILVSLSFVVRAHIFKDYKSKEHVLTSVYDAMKSNLQQDLRQMNDSRNKRNTVGNEKLVEYYDNQPSDSNNEWSVINSPPASDLVCTQRKDTSQTRITVSDHSTTGLTLALILKWGLAVLAALFLPVLLFKLFILPFKVLLGLKAISLLNSLLLGTLLLKYKISKPYGYPIIGTVPGSGDSSSSSASSPSSAGATSHSLELNQDSSDYIDVIRPNEDLRRILNFVKERNKNW